jgi:hypothetical protein
MLNDMAACMCRIAARTACRFNHQHIKRRKGDDLGMARLVDFAADW